MSLVIALGSNIGDKEKNLKEAISYLSKAFGNPISTSNIYCSEPFGEIAQDDFLNMCIEFMSPKKSPIETLHQCLEIEEKMGRVRSIKWGPRIIDIDILYFDDKAIQSKELVIPHPHIKERSFVVLPLTELNIFDDLKRKHTYNTKFSTKSFIYQGPCATKLGQ